MKNNKTKRIVDTLFVVLAVAVFIFYCVELIVLHYNQILYPVTKRFESDLPQHIYMALSGWGYSLMAVVFRLFSVFPEFWFNMAVAVFLCFCEACTISATYFFLRKNNVELKLSALLALASGFVFPAYIRSVQPYRYIGYQSGSIWHNSTFTVMKLTALICLVLYLSISEKYKESMKISHVVLFSILLAVTTSVKANFILVFAPVALLFLILDGILKVPVKRLLICALTVIPSILVILFQEYVLFGESTGNGIIIDPLYSVYLRAEKPYFTMLLSAAFPIAVFLYNIIPVMRDTFLDFKNKKGRLTHRAFLLAWTMWFVAFMQLILLRETGERELDDNFAWGYDFCLFILFVVSIIYFVRNASELINGISHGKLSLLSDISDKTNENKDSGKKQISVLKTVAGTVVTVISLALLSYHTYCGITFFVKLMQGETYFMQ